MKAYHSRKIVYKLWYAILTHCILYKATYNEIERKTKVKHDTVRKIVIHVIEQARYKDIYRIFACVRDLNRFDWIP